MIRYKVAQASSLHMLEIFHAGWKPVLLSLIFDKLLRKNLLRRFDGKNVHTLR